MSASELPSVIHHATEEPRDLKLGQPCDRNICTRASALLMQLNKSTYCIKR